MQKGLNKKHGFVRMKRMKDIYKWYTGYKHMALSGCWAARQLRYYDYATTLFTT